MTAHHTLVHTPQDTESKTAMREREKVQALLCEALECLNGVCGSVAGTSVVASVVTHLCLDQILGLAHPSILEPFGLLASNHVSLLHSSAVGLHSGGGHNPAAAAVSAMVRSHAHVLVRLFV